MIGRIGPVRNSRNSGGPRRLGHPECERPVMQQAHLGQEVEIVVTHHHQRGFVTFYRLKKLCANILQRRFQSRIEERHGDTVLPQNCGCQQRLQRRIGLHPRHLLGIRSHVVRVREQYPRRQHVTTSDSRRCASTFGFGGATRRAAHCLNFKSTG